LGIRPKQRQDYSDEVHQAAIEQAIIEQHQTSMLNDTTKA
jgi:biotin synthase